MSNIELKMAGSTPLHIRLSLAMEAPGTRRVYIYIWYIYRSVRRLICADSPFLLRQKRFCISAKCPGVPWDLFDDQPLDPRLSSRDPTYALSTGCLGGGGNESRRSHPIIAMISERKQIMTTVNLF